MAHQSATAVAPTHRSVSTNRVGAPSREPGCERSEGARRAQLVADYQETGTRCLDLEAPNQELQTAMSPRCMRATLATSSRTRPSTRSPETVRRPRVARRAVVQALARLGDPPRSPWTVVGCNWSRSFDTLRDEEPPRAFVVSVM
jgi:hypothetical protein